MFSFAIHVCSVLLALSGHRSIEWGVSIDLNTPGSATVHLSGTLQDVVARMEKDYPGWNETFSQPDEHYGALRQHIRH
ncbi:hypothetical protein QC762_400515 [Podospora pseudocomata]|uniref:Uncharacterized protein n=1 Tax=Podospora pseudocomata TaxID=2093779 RepID=A0ABR0GE93_9PEZI|nr:hypothetical protein QC762_400515 [Podospora pseudocomata]